jgi:diacylglycerol kinase family enzyme
VISGTDVSPQIDIPSHATTRRLRVVINRGGRLVERSPEEVQLQLEMAFAAAGALAEFEIVPAKDLQARLEAARDAGKRGEIDAVVIGGGDGSVSSAAGLLADTGVPLGVLPLGTLNHFAKDLGMPLELEEAAAAIARGELKTVDVGEVNGHSFVNNSVLGVYPYMVIDRERRRRRHGLGKWVAMSLAFVRMLWRFPRRRLKLEIAGEDTNYRTPCLFVGVNEYGLNRLELRRKSGMDRGELWLLVAKHQHSWSFLRFALRAAFGGLEEAGDFDLHRCGTADVRTRARRVPVACDGEVVRLRSPLHYRLRPHALTVLVPSAAMIAPTEL